jgi:hypothetical protein
MYGNGERKERAAQKRGKDMLPKKRGKDVLSKECRAHPYGESTERDRAVGKYDEEEKSLRIGVVDVCPKGSFRRTS